VIETHGRDPAEAAEAIIAELERRGRI